MISANTSRLSILFHSLQRSPFGQSCLCLLWAVLIVFCSYIILSVFIYWSESGYLPHLVNESEQSHHKLTEGIAWFAVIMYSGTVLGLIVAAVLRCKDCFSRSLQHIQTDLQNYDLEQGQLLQKRQA